jgi:predicted NBD/HSP70 family sugar kinase/mannose-6-phosphate isomerase class I
VIGLLIALKLKDRCKEMSSTKRIGIDVGGSHISACIIDPCKEGRQSLNFFRKDIDSGGSAYSIITAIGNCIKEVAAGETNIDSVGLAFPGPFNYEKGISAITGVGGKFEKTFGLHIAQALKDFTGLQAPFGFANDAHCFAIGAYKRYCLKSKRAVFLTLGTGFGSAFIKDGELLHHHSSIPSSGCFYDQEFLDATAEDYISTRWFLKEFEKRTGTAAASVKEIATDRSEISCQTFKDFGHNLGRFLLPWLLKFDCDELVIGGSISKAKDLFDCYLRKELSSREHLLNIIYADDTDECILTGAALIPSKTSLKTNAETFRKTKQPLLPVTTRHLDGYNVFPSHRSSFRVYKGFESLAEKIRNEKTVIIDGYGGVLWEIFREQLQEALRVHKKKVFWFDINTCLHSADRINEMVAPALNGNDPVFGKRYTGSLSDFFDDAKLQLLQPDEEIDLNIIYGTGAALSNWNGMLLYVDLPKNEIQYRMRAGSIFNVGADALSTNAQMYKRFYFIDWPVLNKHKEQLLASVDCIIDEQRVDNITCMNGEDFQNTLDEILDGPFRARPWFEAGVWGGDWMKEHLKGLNNDEVNYAWSFELITPENGVVIEGDNNLLEVSFDFLLFANNNKLLGNAALRFGKEFPIRFDFLDTFNGGNLSVQCHPRTEYISKNFGESFTQDETYYILDCEEDAKVYLGFQENIDAKEFKSALVNAQENNIEVQVEKFVQKHDAHKHDFFLIPNGTIHASGKNNLVLEISSTPYIFTFKMYDWLRLDLNGEPRPINIEHAFNNLYFDRKGNYVQQYLLSQPIVVEEFTGGRKMKLPTHQEHFYTVDRYEFTGTVQIKTNNQCQVCMLVEGEEIEVVANKKESVFHYAETFIIPAAVGSYEIKQRKNKKAFVVVAYVKEEYC